MKRAARKAACWLARAAREDVGRGARTARAAGTHTDRVTAEAVRDCPHEKSRPEGGLLVGAGGLEPPTPTVSR